ncbi:unnamed protein product [Paramecium octaurelia]|uniref:Uncharacterized protein n=1 Tax=Paramecium octaurelia TaxID=43137 RepID=A0A8S1SCF3_PAROT|nr:unnamed protein product [Paramecium octaurelia]
MLKNQMNQFSKDYLLELEQQNKFNLNQLQIKYENFWNNRILNFNPNQEKTKIKSNQNSISQSPLTLKQQQDHLFQSNYNYLLIFHEMFMWLVPIDYYQQIIISNILSYNQQQYKSICQLQDSISDHRKRKQFIITKKLFQGNKNLKNSKGLITNFDEYIYIEQAGQGDDLEISYEQLETNLNQLKYRKLKYLQSGSLKAQKRIKTQKQVDEISDDYSLQSIYEVNLEVLYDQTNQLTKKLKEMNDAGFIKELNN